MNHEKKLKYAEILQELLKVKLYDNISVNDICSKCGTYRSNFYYHFKSKDDLAKWFFTYNLCNINECTENIKERQTLLLKHMNENEVLYLKSFYLKSSGDLYLFIKEKIIEYICSYRRIADEDIYDTKRFKLEYLSAGWNKIVWEWLNGNINLSVDELSDFLYRFIIDFEI